MSPDYAPDYSGCVLPYAQWFQDDFLGGVRGMRAHEIGIYTILLMEMYARGRPIDISAARLARLCGADLRTFTKALDMLISDGKIIQLKCGLWNQRCENAFRERAKMQEQQRRAGGASARKRNDFNDGDERSFNERSTDVEPSSEAQKVKEETNVSSKKKGSRIPADWRLPKDWGDWALSQGISETDTRREAEKFFDYWQSVAGQKGVKLDWLGVWRNWIRKAVENKSSRKGGSVATRDASGNLTNDFLFNRG